MTESKPGGIQTDAPPPMQIQRAALLPLLKALGYDETGPTVNNLMTVDWDLDANRIRIVRERLVGGMYRRDASGNKLTETFEVVVV
jgi:hypothetical protein